MLVLRKYREHARKSVWEQTILPMIENRSDFTIQYGELSAFSTRTGGSLRVDGLDDAERVEKVFGTEYLHLFFNEAVQLSWAAVENACTRLAQPIDGDPLHKAIFDCNPRGQRHWLYRMAIMGLNADGEPLTDAARSCWKRQHWTPYDNPHLPKDTLASYENMTGVRRRRLLLGEWCDTEGSVYDEFDETIHAFDDLPPASGHWPRSMAIDFGYTNPFAALWCAKDDDGCLWLYREHYKDKTLVTEHGRIITEYCKSDPSMPHPRWADHDAEDRATLEALGIYTLPATKDVLRGIQRVKDRLAVQPNGKPRLMISRKCVNLIAEMYDYSWQQQDEGKAIKEQPVKIRDHAVDCLRYLVMGHDDTGSDGSGGDLGVDFGIRL